MIEITEDKLDKMGEYVEDVLWASGELMHCIEKMKNERGGYGNRDYRGSKYGNRYGGSMRYKDDEWDDDDDEMMERRGRRRRDSRGRYM